MKVLCFIVLTVLLLSGSYCQDLQAATDYESLLNAFQYTSASNHDVNIVLNSGTYLIDPNNPTGLHLYDAPSKSRTIRLLASGNPIIKCPEGSINFTPITFDGVFNVEIDGIVFQNCYKNGSIANDYSPSPMLIVWNGVRTKIQNCVFRNLYSNFGGSAVWIFNETQAFIDSCLFENNTSAANGDTIGGALTITLASYQISNSQFYGNVGYLFGAALYVDLTASLYGNITNSLFSANTGFDNGGAIYIHGDEDMSQPKSYLYIRNITVEENTINVRDEAAGAGAQITDTVTVIESSVFRYNKFGCSNCTSYGGGLLFSSLRLENSPIIIRDSFFYGNNASFGGGLFVTNWNGGVPNTDTVTCTIIGSQILDNYATGGAGLYIDMVGANITNTVIKNNVSPDWYPSSMLVSLAKLQMNRVYLQIFYGSNFLRTITENPAGGFRCTNSSVKILESSVYRNDFFDFICDGPYCSWEVIVPNDTCINSCTSRDPCSVCAGNSTCLGCDNVPWAPACSPSSTSSPPPQLNSTTGSSPISTPKKHSSSSALGAIIGGVVGGVALIAVVAFVVVFKRRSKKEKPVRDIEMTRKTSTLSMKSVQNVELREKLGSGAFSEVYKGIWNKTTLVALKLLKNPSQITEFETEANILLSLSHTNIVQFFGIYTDSTKQKFIVTEFMSEGSLRPLLLSDTPLTKLDLLAIARDVASGLVYLSDQSIVHADLAARNILLNLSANKEVKYQAKIGDLGLGKVLKSQREYYVSTSGSAFPVRWSPPEVIEYGKYSVASDVWSFGVTLFELFSQGKLPYASFSNEQILDKIKEGYRLPQPDECPDILYQMMLKMWAYDAKERPSFSEILDTIIALCGKNVEPPPMIKRPYEDQTNNYN